MGEGLEGLVNEHGFISVCWNNDAVRYHGDYVNKSEEEMANIMKAINGEYPLSHGICDKCYSHENEKLKAKRLEKAETNKILSYYNSKIHIYEYMRAFKPNYNNGRVCHDMNIVLCIMKGTLQTYEDMPFEIVEEGYNRVKKLEKKLRL